MNSETGSQGGITLPPVEQERIKEIFEQVRHHLPYNASTVGNGMSDFTSYYRYFGEADKVKYFRALLKGKPLTDLGCGTNQFMVDFSFRCGATEYVGVDIAHVHKTEERQDVAVEVAQSNGIPGKLFKVRFIADEMLSYLATTSSASSNLTYNGISIYTLDESQAYAKVEKYIQELVTQTARVVPSGGIVFGTGSLFLNKLLSRGDFTLRRDRILLGMPSSFAAQERTILCHVLQKNG